MAKTGLKDAVICGSGKLAGIGVGMGVMDFSFNGGSMGSVVGEKLTRMIERSTAAKQPVIIISTSGGARMQEGALSLMQMAKTSAALGRHALAKLPYISVLTNPTGGDLKPPAMGCLADVLSRSADGLPTQQQGSIRWTVLH